MKPLVIFRGKGMRISFTEQLRYDRRVIVKFQPNAWCDEDIMRFWIKNCWKQACFGPMHLFLDVHWAQKAEEIQDLLEAESNTSVTYVPGGCTSLVQPVDVSFNKPLKSAVGCIIIKWSVSSKDPSVIRQDPQLCTICLLSLVSI